MVFNKCLDYLYTQHTWPYNAAYSNTQRRNIPIFQGSKSRYMALRNLMQIYIFIFDTILVNHFDR